MSFFSFIAGILGSLFKSLFCRSEGERAGAAEEKVKAYEAQNKVREAMQGAEKIQGKSELIDTLRNGKLIVPFALFFLCACSSQPVVVCPNVKFWTGDQQAQMAVDLQQLPEDSPVVGAMVDYHNMRQEARACESIKSGKSK